MGMDKNCAFSCAYGLGAKTTQLTENKLIKELKADAPAWVNLQADHENAANWLQTHLTYLNPITIQALLADETRPRCEVLENGVLLILRGVNLNEGAVPEDMVSVRMWVDPHRVVTMHRRSLKAIEKMEEACQKGQGPQSSAAFITKIIEDLLVVMEPVLQNIEERVDDLEEALMESPNSGLKNELSLIRRRALLLKRYINPQKEAISKLRNTQLEWIALNERMQLQESYDKITRFIEHLDSTRERCQIIQDELATILADRLNRNTYILTLVAGVFLPLGFITGLLGVNLGGIPGVENAYAFWLLCVACGFIVFLEILIFRKLRWF